MIRTPRILSAALGAAFQLCIASIAVAASPYELKIRVTDDAGDSLGTSARAIVRATYPGNAVSFDGTADEQGVIALSAPGDAVPLNIVVAAAAPGYAFEQVTIEKPTGTIERTIVLPRGRAISVILTPPPGMTLPADTRLVMYPPVFGADAWRAAFGELSPGGASFKTDLGFAPAWAAEDGQFAVSVPVRAPEMRILVLAPGLVRAFDAGSFRSTDFAKGTVSITLPEPGALSAVQNVPESIEEPKELSIVLQQVDGQNKTDIAMAEGTGRSVVLNATDLAPGVYWVYGRPCLAKDRFAPGMDLRRYSKAIQIKSGQTTRVEFEYAAPDMSLYRGDYTARLKVASTAGTPAAGVPYAISVQSPMFGEMPFLNGTLDAEGVAVLKGLKGGEQPVPYYLTVGHKRMGAFDLSGDQLERDIVLSLPPVVGDPAPDIVLTDVSTRQPVKLSSFRGKVVFLDFWATWCGPCQKPMQHNNDILTRRAKDWDGKAVIVAVSIDETIDAIQKHIARKQWTNMRHLWAEEGGGGWGARAPVVYGVNSVPTGLLIDAGGKIVWRGNPNGYDVEAGIDQLVAGKPAQP